MNDTSAASARIIRLANLLAPAQDAEMTAADFLDQNPLYRYVHGPREDQTLNVILMGSAPIRKAFFSTIFAAAQMPDTRMRIHVMAEDAAAFYDAWVDDAPLLPRTAAITHIPARPDAGCLPDDRIVDGQPLAELIFETTAAPTAGQILALDPGCVLMLDAYTEKQEQLARELADGAAAPLLICLGAAQDAEPAAPRPVKETAAYRKALAVHTYYEKEYDERIPQDAILKKFENSYNRSSSLRNALSIPYKLHACGLADQPDAARLFYDRVLCAENNDAILSRLIWLERRSWLAFMIVSGFRLPPPEEQEAFIRTHNFTHQDKANKLHLCLCANRDEGIPLPLAAWTLEDWDKRDISGLDPLDQLSVNLHRVLAREVENNTAPRLAETMAQLERRLCPNNAALYQQCRIALDHLLARDPNAHLAWKQVYNRLRAKFSNIQAVQALEPLAELVIKRNRCLDFKDYDLATIRAIPYLMQDRPVRRIYKLYSPHLWDNVAAALFMEPEELTFLTDSPIEADQFDFFSRFLRDRRKLSVRLRQISLEALEAAEADSVVDITGATAHQILDAQQHPLLAALPVIEYKNGRLVNPDRKYGNIRFYNRHRSLTVEEMLSLTGATMLSNQEEIPMLGLERYDELWKIAQQYPNYNIACTMLSDKNNPQNFSASDIRRSDTPWITYLTRADAYRCGLGSLLDDLEAAGVIQTPQWGAMAGGTAIVAQHPLMQASLGFALNKVIMQLTMTPGCSFTLNTRPDHFSGGIFSCQILCNGNSLCLIIKTRSHEITLSRDEAHTTGLEELLNQLQSASIIRNVKWGRDGKSTFITAVDPYYQHSLNLLLEAYEQAGASARELKLVFCPDQHDHRNAAVTLEKPTLAYRRRNVPTSGDISFSKSGPRIPARDFIRLLKRLWKEGFITTADGAAPCTVSPSGDSCDIAFEFADAACKDCLTKEGNILEAFAYHTIRQMNLFDDVKLSVNIRWDKLGVDARDTSNEIDIICTKGVKSYFISCKKRVEIDKEHLNEIRYEADRFGVDSTPILLTTARLDGSNANNLIQHYRAKRMGIEIISLQDFIPALGTPQDSAKALARQLTAIVNPS